MVRVNLPNSTIATINSFTGRTWILPIILQWLDESMERFFVITGEPGAGKSMLAAWLSGFGPSPIAPAPFCQYRLRHSIPGNY